MRKLSIVHTESSLGWGGQEIRILSESKGLIARGHEVKLLTPPEARIFGAAREWGVPVLPMPIAKKRLTALKFLVEWFRDNPCDVVSTHSSTDSWLSAIAMLVLGKPYPIVRTRHISAPVSTNFLSRWLYTRAARRVVTAGEALKRELVERNGFPASRIDSVPTGIDAKRFQPGDKAAARTALNLPHGLLVGIVATLRSWKGHRYLIDALPEGAQLVIVGDGPQRDSLEGQVKTLRLENRVRFAGNQADVVPWLQALDVFALPSYANEGVPQALVQAMLVGLPCVTTAVGSIPEIAKDGETALVVPPQDAPALKTALQRLIADEALRRRLGEAARRHCEAGYSYERMLDRMEEIYASVAGVPLMRPAGAG